MIITKPIEVECLNCSTINEILPSEFDEPEISTDERSMGIETGYYWNLETDCVNCMNNLNITISAFEYPIGFLNLVESECKGGKISVKPLIEIDNVE